MRSLLLVPADAPQDLERALGSGADALVLDLEDSVAPAAKVRARRGAAEFLRTARARPSAPRLWVRVNGAATGLLDDDLAAIVPEAPAGVMLPKAAGGTDIVRLAAKLAVAEAEAGIADGATKIIAIATETAAALFAMGTYAESSPRLAALTWGSEDLAADLGAETNRLRDGSYAEPYRLARSLTLAAAAAAEVPAIDSIYTRYRDLDGLWTDAEAARRDGFGGKLAIHPDQVSVINTVFTPSAATVAAARAVVEAFAAHPEDGVVFHEGRVLDRSHLKQADGILRRAAAAGTESPQQP